MKRNLGVLAMIVFIDMMGIGLVMPVMPSLIQSLTGDDIGRAAEIGGWLLFAYAAMQFVFSPIIGGLSDRFGRRPVLLTTLTLLGVDYFVMSWAPTITWLFAGRLMSGIMGASWAAANSCIADSIPRERRGAAFGKLGAAGAAGFVLGPAIGGAIGQFGDRLPFLAAACMCLVGAVIGMAWFQETLPESRRRRFDPFRANPFGSIAQMAKMPLVLGLLATTFFMQLAAQAQISVWAYYGTAKFDWSPLMIGGTIAFYGVLLGATQGLLAGRAISRFGPATTAVASLCFAVPSFVLIAFAPNTAAILVAMMIGAIAGMSFPAMQQMMSARTEENAQGELQGAIGSTVSLTAIVGPPLMTGIFGAFADDRGLHFPGAPFLLSASLMVLAIAILAYTLARHPTG